MTNELTAREQVLPKLREVFREHGYEGTSLSVITEQTGLGKSSIYHHFPNGKIEMAEAVLDDIGYWFEEYVFKPLRECEDAIAGIKLMFKEVNRYFDSGNRICLVGAFALDNTREQFPEKVKDYFKAWVDALSIALKQRSITHADAKVLAEDAVLTIQGALVLARSQDDVKIFTRALKRLEKRMLNTIYE